MKLLNLHEWNVTIPEALALQKRLATCVLRTGRVTAPRFIAGVDASIKRSRGEGTAAVVVLEYPRLGIVETRIVRGEVNFPYIPGLLTFRESPLALQAFARLQITPDIVMVDGQGIAHPRRIGFASHLGLFLDTPTIGCAKSRLCGEHEEKEKIRGNHADLMHEGDRIGAAVWTRDGSRPLYVSIGHKIDLESAVHWVMECSRGFRIPEPTRLAHLAAGGYPVEAS